MLSSDYTTEELIKIDTGTHIVGDAMPEIETWIALYKEGTPKSFLLALVQHDGGETNNSVAMYPEVAGQIAMRMIEELPQPLREQVITALFMLRGQIRLFCECMDCRSTWHIWRRTNEPTGAMRCDECDSIGVIAVPDENAPILN